MKLSAERLVRHLHRDLIRETSECQQKILLMEALLAKFHVNAISPLRLLQDSDRALAGGPDAIKRHLQDLYARIEENLETIRELEAKLEEKNFADLKGMVEYIVARGRARKEVKE